MREFGISTRNTSPVILRVSFSRVSRIYYSGGFFFLYFIYN